MKSNPPFPIPKTMPKFAANLHYLYSEVLPFQPRQANEESHQKKRGARRPSKTT
jgi:hypothetical protein